MEVSICLDRVSTLWKRTSRLSKNSWQFEKWHLNKSQWSLFYKVSICLYFYLCLNRDTWSRHFEKRHLDCQKILDSLKNDILTNLNKVYAIKSQFVSIFIFVSIETLDRDTLKKDISTVKKFMTVWKMTFWQISTKSMLYSLDLSRFLSLSQSRLLIKTIQKRHLDCWESLDTLKKDISILILISLDSQDLQSYFFSFNKNEIRT